MFEVNNKDTRTTPLANYSRNGLIQKNYEYGYRMNGGKSAFYQANVPLPYNKFMAHYSSFPYYN